MRCICPNSNSTEERYQGAWARGSDGRGHVAHCLTMDQAGWAFITNYPFALTFSVSFHNEIGAGTQDQGRHIPSLIPAVGLTPQPIHSFWIVQ